MAVLEVLRADLTQSIERRLDSFLVDFGTAGPADGFVVGQQLVGECIRSISIAGVCSLTSVSESVEDSSTSTLTVEHILVEPDDCLEFVHGRLEFLDAVATLLQVSFDLIDLGGR